MTYGWAKPGVKCVCLTDFRHENFDQAIYAPNLPVRGGTYTIRETGPCPVGKNLTLTFVELVNLDFKQLGEAGFGVEHFRPLVQQRTEAEDVAQFRHLLDVPSDLEAV